MVSYLFRMAVQYANESLSGSSDYDSEQDDDGLNRVLSNVMDDYFSSSTDDYINAMLTGNPYQKSTLNKKNYPPKTTLLNKSQFSLITKQSSGIAVPKRKMEEQQNNNLACVLSNRERGSYPNNQLSHAKRCKISNNYLPNTSNILDSCAGKIFCGIFSKDGTYFLSASQDRTVRVYNSSDGSYNLVKSLRARDIGWSVVDVAFSPDKQHFVYSTWSSALHLCSVSPEIEHQEPLCFLDSSRRFCIFSVVFSADGNELLGGANDGCLYIYNRECKRQTLRVPAHQYDVNSVVFADDSSQIIYSGGDDGIVRVWDRRTMDESQPKQVGFLAGHLDGITFVNSRGDGRHLISNSKDQSIKLWDVRVFSSEKAAEKGIRVVQNQPWDYRWQEVPKKLYTSRKKIEGDTSIMTYRGHVVIKTLLRCRFSPAETTGSRYIYTACGRGRVVIYDSLTGKIVNSLSGHNACVRDVDWHPHRDEILSSGWDGLVGKWVYMDPYSSIEYEEMKCESAMYKDEWSYPLRRSQRLADKTRKNN